MSFLAVQSLDDCRLVESNVQFNHIIKVRFPVNLNASLQLVDLKQSFTGLWISRSSKSIPSCTKN